MKTSRFVSAGLASLTLGIAWMPAKAAPPGC